MPSLFTPPPVATSPASQSTTRNVRLRSGRIEGRSSARRRDREAPTRPAGPASPFGPPPHPPGPHRPSAPPHPPGQGYRPDPLGQRHRPVPRRPSRPSGPQGQSHRSRLGSPLVPAQCRLFRGARLGSRRGRVDHPQDADLIGDAAVDHVARVRVVRARKTSRRDEQNEHRCDDDRRRPGRATQDRHLNLRGCGQRAVASGLPATSAHRASPRPNRRASRHQRHRSIDRWSHVSDTDGVA